MPGENRMVRRYFDSWESYDISTLRDIFSDDVVYVIHPIGRTLRGLNPVCRYWMRNERRQRNLSLEWRTTSQRYNGVAAVFVAAFFDAEENEQQTVRGIIYFHFGVVGKITILRENYRKFST